VLARERRDAADRRHDRRLHRRRRCRATAPTARSRFT
jgi:hypothetical protein